LQAEALHNSCLRAGERSTNSYTTPRRVVNYLWEINGKTDMCPAVTTSALGQKPTFEVMSALPPKADKCSAAMDVRFGPKADIASLIQ
jgi:CxxC motif-containing protein